MFYWKRLCLLLIFLDCVTANEVVQRLLGDIHDDHAEVQSYDGWYNNIGNPSLGARGKPDINMTEKYLKFVSTTSFFKLKRNFAFRGCFYWRLQIRFCNQSEKEVAISVSVCRDKLKLKLPTGSLNKNMSLCGK